MTGVVLAGGAGRRMAPAGVKAAVLLGGRPLAAYPVAALAAVCDRVAVVCKNETELPDLRPAERWEEPDEPRHPLAGILFALERAAGPVLVCAADMPFVTPAACRSLLAAAAGRGAAVPRAAVAVSDGALEPLLGVYAPGAAETLAAAPPDAPLRAAVEALDPARVALPARITASVNTPEELAEAEAAVAGRSAY